MKKIFLIFLITVVSVFLLLVSVALFFRMVCPLQVVESKRPYIACVLDESSWILKSRFFSMETMQMDIYLV